MGELASAVAGKLFEEGLKGLVHKLLRRRAEIARQILLSELASGDAVIQDVEDVDEAAAMVFEFMTAAQRGAGRINLRLMAQVFQKEVTTPPLYADNFLRWASLLASLSREEVIAVVAFHKMKRRHEALRAADPNAFLGRQELDPLIGPGKVFRDDNEFYRHISALTRTGLVVARSGWSSLVYETTDLMVEMLRLIDLDIAIQEPRR